jgi:hypothetical protein
MHFDPMTHWKILHVEMGRHLHGGAQQVVHLITGLRARGVENVLACARDSEIAASLAGVAERIGRPHGWTGRPVGRLPGRPFAAG